VVSEKGDRPSQKVDDEIPRQGLLATMPKRTFYRVVLLLAALAGIIYLRQRTSAIAGWMASAFNIPPAAEHRAAPTTIKARVLLPTDSSEKTH
jgi:uncharacterized membrane protein